MNFDKQICKQLLKKYKKNNAKVKSAGEIAEEELSLSNRTVMIGRNIEHGVFWFYTEKEREPEIQVTLVEDPRSQDETLAFRSLETSKIVGILPREEFKNLSTEILEFKITMDCEDEDWQTYSQTIPNPN